jgi:hypothetical protein
MNRIEDVEPQGLFPFFVLFILLVLSSNSSLERSRSAEFRQDEQD